MTESQEPTVSPEDLRRQLRSLGPDTQKIVGGLVVIMMRDSERIREREWLLENFTVLAAKAKGLSEAQTQELQAFVQAERDGALNAAFALFLRVAADLEGLGKHGDQPATLGQATVIALSYFE